MDKLEIKEFSDNEEIINKEVYIKTIEEGTTKTGNTFLKGELTDGVKTMQYKLWNTAESFNYVLNNKDEIMQNPVINISGKANIFNNSCSIIIENVNYIAIERTREDYLPRCKEEVIADFKEVLARNLTETGKSIVNLIFQKDNIGTRFIEEFAGAKMHDARVHGLLNHTRKMMNILETLFKNDERLETIRPHIKDLMFLGILVHDIGKIYEMNFGVYTEYSYVGHKTFGVELIKELENDIVEAYSKDFYYQILAIIEGHHGEFEQLPRTIAAQLIHYIDMLESQTTGILDSLEREEHSVNATGKILKRTTSGGKFYTITL